MIRMHVPVSLTERVNFDRSPQQNLFKTALEK